MKSFVVISLVLLFAGCSEQGNEAIGIEPAQRVVSLAPSLTEIICAIGADDQLVGRTSACDYPPDLIKDIPVIGNFGDPSLELLIAAKPDLILTADLREERAGQKIDELGLTRKRIKCSRLDDIPTAIIEIGKLLKKEDAAIETADALKREIASLRNNLSGINRPSVFVEIWSKPLMTAGKDSFISELIQLAGGRNIGDRINKDFFRTSSEWVISMDPDIILYLAHPKERTSLSNVIFTRSGWNQISAVKNKHIYDDFDLDSITRAGPRVIEGIKQLRSCIIDGSGKHDPPAEKSDVKKAIFMLRLDRILTGFFVGAALACAGVVFQALLRNPLAEPYILGVSSGAGLGTALAFVSGLAAISIYALPLCAFIFAVITLVIVYMLASSNGRLSIYSLILSGVIVSAVCGSLLMFLISLSPDKMPHVMWWMLGDLELHPRALMIATSIITTLGAIGVWIISPELNAMSLGNEMAHYVGVRTKLATTVGLLLATLMTASAVAVAGLIGFVGLIIPHVMRNLTGPDHRKLVPASVIVGGIFLVICDLAAKTILGPAEEIPVGVITALVGGPFFIIILRRKRKQGWTE
ncbi:iron chelate uptake ABC transporter family permease subunit [Verrucomicrobiota bacterium]